MALGEILKNAREQRGLTPSAVAESTHMKVQVVEDLEREEFKRIAAPIYGRGFVKLYAEFLQLDPEPLIRDFMELYSGAHVTAVRLKKSDSATDTPETERQPVTRTVTGATAPLRQAVQARPAVRPLSAPLPRAPEADVANSNRFGAGPSAGTGAAVSAESAGSAPQDMDQEQTTVVPEEIGAESDEPDLFRPQSLRSRPAVVDEDTSGRRERAAQEAPHKRKFSIFRIGGRLQAEEERAPAAQTDHVRHSARVQAFLAGVRRLKQGVERNLTDSLPQKQMIALCGAAALFVAVIAAGVGLLFKMTGANASADQANAIESVAAPPSLYVD